MRLALVHLAFAIVTVLALVAGLGVLFLGWEVLEFNTLLICVVTWLPAAIVSSLLALLWTKRRAGADGLQVIQIRKVFGRFLVVAVPIVTVTTLGAIELLLRSKDSY